MMSKQLNYAVSTKSGKTHEVLTFQAKNFTVTFCTATYKDTQPNWSCKTLALSPPTLHCFRGIYCLQHTTEIDILPGYLHGHHFFQSACGLSLGFSGSDISTLFST